MQSSIGQQAMHDALRSSLVTRRGVEISKRSTKPPLYLRQHGDERFLPLGLLLFRFCNHGTTS